MERALQRKGDGGFAPLAGRDSDAAEGWSHKARSTQADFYSNEVRFLER